MGMRICLFGFGEVGQILGADLAARDVHLCAWDVKFLDPASQPSNAVARNRHVHAAGNAHDAVRHAELIISAVTADQALPAARAAAASLATNTCFLDLNSVSPAVKQQAAQVIHEVGGRYIEAAVMSAFPPKRLAVPIHLGGPHAPVFAPIARAMGLSNVTVFSIQLGVASAAKMCRSIIIKGMEALILESMLTARHYGVEQSVLDSLADLLPTSDWRALSQYMMSRALLHGRRRAEEMTEAAATTAAAGLEPLMGTAIAQRQAWAGAMGSIAQQESLQRMLDSLLEHTTKQQVAS
jgi:3-hydroxyisobutyrate dehydrogenase-like beta-hydroxyacid dehydrogenase